MGRDGRVSLAAGGKKMVPHSDGNGIPIVKLLPPVVMGTGMPTCFLLGMGVGPREAGE